MISMFICGIVGGIFAAFFAWPYGWLAALAAYAFGGAVCAIVPALFEWRREVLRGRADHRHVSEGVSRQDRHVDRV